MRRLYQGFLIITVVQGIIFDTCGVVKWISTEESSKENFNDGINVLREKVVSVIESQRFLIIARTIVLAAAGLTRVSIAPSILLPKKKLRS